jgi:polyvinyl alcohol dehydrogenase (cytochrome)
MTAGDAYTVACRLMEPGSGNCPEARGPDFDFGSSPILVRLRNGKRALIAGQKSGVVYAVDPDRQGALLWQRRIGKGGKQGGVRPSRLFGRWQIGPWPPSRGFASQ